MSENKKEDNLDSILVLLRNMKSLEAARTLSAALISDRFQQMYLIQNEVGAGFRSVTDSYIRVLETTLQCKSSITETLQAKEVYEGYKRISYQKGDMELSRLAAEIDVIRELLAQREE